MYHLSTCPDNKLFIQVCFCRILNKYSFDNKFSLPVGATCISTEVIIFHTGRSVDCTWFYTNNCIQKDDFSTILSPLNHLLSCPAKAIRPGTISPLSKDWRSQRRGQTVQTRRSHSERLPTLLELLKDVFPSIRFWRWLQFNQGYQHYRYLSGCHDRYVQDFWKVTIVTKITG